TLEHHGRTTNTFINGHERTVFVYKYFLETCPTKELRKIARNQYAFHLTEASVMNIKQGNYRQALQQYGTAFVRGDHPGHLFSALWRAFLHTNPGKNTEQGDTLL